METMVELLLNGDNVRMMLMVMIGYCWYVRLNSSFDKKLGGLDKKIDGVEHSLSKRIDEVEYSLGKRIDEVEHSLGKRIDEVEHSLNKRIDGVEAAVHQIKTNDLAHLNNTIRALTFTLEKNKYLEKEDKEYVDSMLGL